MKIICWNIQGMHSTSKRAVIKVVVSSVREFLFFQEKKMELIDDNIMRSICPWSHFHFVMFPSIGASGKTLIAWNALYCQKLDEFVGRYSTSVHF